MFFWVQHSGWQPLVPVNTMMNEKASQDLCTWLVKQEQKCLILLTTRRNEAIMLQRFLVTWTSFLLFYHCSCGSLCIYQESVTSALAICLRSVPCNKKMPWWASLQEVMSLPFPKNQKDSVHACHFLWTSSSFMVILHPSCTDKIQWEGSNWTFCEILQKEDCWKVIIKKHKLC